LKNNTTTNQKASRGKRDPGRKRSLTKIVRIIDYYQRNQSNQPQRD